MSALPSMNGDDFDLKFGDPDSRSSLGGYDYNQPSTGDAEFGPLLFNGTSYNFGAGAGTGDELLALQGPGLGAPTHQLQAQMPAQMMKLEPQQQQQQQQQHEPDISSGTDIIMAPTLGAASDDSEVCIVDVEMTSGSKRWEAAHMSVLTSSRFVDILYTISNLSQFDKVVVDGIEVPSNATIGSVLATRLSAALPLVSFALTNNIKSCTRLGCTNLHVKKASRRACSVCQKHGYVVDVTCLRVTASNNPYLEPCTTELDSWVFDAGAYAYVMFLSPEMAVAAEQTSKRIQSEANMALRHVDPTLSYTVMMRSHFWKLAVQPYAKSEGVVGKPVYYKKMTSKTAGAGAGRKRARADESVSDSSGFSPGPPTLGPEEGEVQSPAHPALVYTERTSSTSSSSSPSPEPQQNGFHSSVVVSAADFDSLRTGEAAGAELMVLPTGEKLPVMLVLLGGQGEHGGANGYGYGGGGSGGGHGRGGGYGGSGRGSGNSGDGGGGGGGGSGRDSGGSRKMQRKDGGSNGRGGGDGDGGGYGDSFLNQYSLLGGKGVVMLPSLRYFGPEEESDDGGAGVLEGVGEEEEERAVAEQELGGGLGFGASPEEVELLPIRPLSSRENTGLKQRNIAKRQESFEGGSGTKDTEEPSKAKPRKSVSQNFALPVLNTKLNVATLSVLGLLGLFTSCVLAFNATPIKFEFPPYSNPFFRLLHTRDDKESRGTWDKWQTAHLTDAVNVMQTNSDVFEAWLGTYTGGGAVTSNDDNFDVRRELGLVTQSAKESIKVTGAVGDLYNSALGRPLASHYNFANNANSPNWRKRGPGGGKGPPPMVGPPGGEGIQGMERGRLMQPPGEGPPPGKGDGPGTQWEGLADDRSLLQNEPNEASTSLGDDNMRLQTGAFSQGLKLESTARRSVNFTVSMRAEGEVRCAVIGTAAAEPSAAEVFAGLPDAVFDSGLLPMGSGASRVTADGLQPGTAYVVYCAASSGGGTPSLVFLGVETLPAPPGFDAGLTEGQEEQIAEEFCAKVDGEVGGAYLRELLCEEGERVELTGELEILCAQPVIGGKIEVTVDLCLVAAYRLMRGYYVYAPSPTVEGMLEVRQDFRMQCASSLSTVLLLDSLLSNRSAPEPQEKAELNGVLFLLVIVGAPSVSLLLLGLAWVLRFALVYVFKLAAPDQTIAESLV